MKFTGWNIIIYVFFILLLTVETVRSLLHMLLADGGASSIAGIDTSGTNGVNLISIFGQWGTTQLVLAVLCWILFIYDDTFMTLIFGIIALEYFLRIVEGWFKPLQSSTPPPGASLAYVILPLSIIFMIWSYYIHGKWI
jgi:hypothetical protein